MGWAYSDLIIDETQDETGALGLSFLSRHMITLDFPRYLVYVRRGRDADRKDEIDMSGLVIVRVASQDIAHVSEGGPAYQAGLRDGDIILAVDGKAADKWDLIDLRILLCSKDGCLISLTYWRDGESRKTKFFLRRRL